MINRERKLLPEEKEIIVDEIIKTFTGYGKRLSLAQIFEILESTKDAFNKLPIQF